MARSGRAVVVAAGFILAFLTLLVGVMLLPPGNLARSSGTPTLPQPVEAMAASAETSNSTSTIAVPDSTQPASGPEPDGNFRAPATAPPVRREALLDAAGVPAPLPAKPGSEGEDWRLTFADEFDKNAINRAWWNTSFWWGRTRLDELQYYTDDSVEVAGDILSLRTERAQREGYDFTSGLVTTQGKFSQAYGFFEVRSKMPAGNGLWSAVWLMPEAGNRTIWPPELDIVEFMGSRPRSAFMNYHYTTPSNPHGQASKSYQGADFSADFHTFGLEWAPGTLTWYIDGVQRYQVRQNVPSIPMYVIANLAVGDWGGDPDRSTPFPSRFQVDYIRVWQFPGR